MASVKVYLLTLELSTVRTKRFNTLRLSSHTELFCCPGCQVFMFYRHVLNDLIMCRADASLIEILIHERLVKRKPEYTSCPTEGA